MGLIWSLEAADSVLAAGCGLKARKRGGRRADRPASAAVRLWTPAEQSPWCTRAIAQQGRQRAAPCQRRQLSIRA